MTLITKYRPQSFGDVVGHTAIVKALEATVKAGRARTFLFTGPSGCGKTTLARLVAQAGGCEPSDLLEVDAATNTGIDAMRDIIDQLQYRPIGGGEVKAVILDEMHALSKPAVQALLKALEEPGKWVYWLLCTTELTRVLPTVRTRCFHCDLKPVDNMLPWLSSIAKKEKLKLSTEVLRVCLDAANGSPRQALSNLAVCAEAKNAKAAHELLRTVASDKGEAVDLARLLVQGGRWRDIQACLRSLAAADPESVRRVVRAYVGQVVRNTPKEPAAGRGLEILDAFDGIFYDAAALDLACGKVILGGGNE